MNNHHIAGDGAFFPAPSGAPGVPRPRPFQKKRITIRPCPERDGWFVARIEGEDVQADGITYAAAVYSLMLNFADKLDIIFDDGPDVSTSDA